jgi:phage tail sheath protein FI
MPEEISYPGVYIEEIPGAIRTIEGVATSVTAFVGRAAIGPLDDPIHITSLVDYERAFGGLGASVGMGPSVRLFFANGGRAALIVRTAAALVPRRRKGTGIYALDRAELAFNLLCLPPGPRRRRPEPLSATAARLAAASAYCEERRAILLIDPPRDWVGPADMVGGPIPLSGYTAGVRRASAALYFPWLTAVDAAGAPLDVPPGGGVAGMIARIDISRGVAKAPAGGDAHIDGVRGLRTVLSDDDASAVTALGVNPLRPVRGGSSVVAWGARTLDGADGSPSDWKYVHVRRLALFIEASIDAGLRWVVFEPNAEPLWARVRGMVESFLYGQFITGAFPGSTTAAAYFVRCGRDTMTQNDINGGVLRVLVGFAPIKPAEFIVISIAVTAAAPPPP